MELDCDDEAQATEELYHLGWVLELAGGRDDATWVARTEVDRECQRFFRHAVPESVNMLVDERRRTDPTITKLGSDMSVPMHALPMSWSSIAARWPKAGLSLLPGDTSGTTICM